jgi:hypothetical protein
MKVPAFVRDGFRAGLTPDQIYAQSGRRRAVYLAAIIEEARVEGEFAAFEPTPKNVELLRDKHSHRWERIAVRVFGDPKRTRAAMDLYDKAKGRPGAAQESYTCRGRRFPKMQGVDSVSDLQKLIDDLLAIYTKAGREVTYVTEAGEPRAYWPNRYLQAVRRAIDKDEVVGFVERLVTRDDVTRGFGYLQDAGRVDLTVEALVVDEAKPYHHLFNEEAVLSSQARLLEASDVYQLHLKVQELRTQRDRLDDELRVAEGLLTFADEHGFGDLAAAREALAQRR